MRKATRESIIIQKEAWKFLWNLERQMGGFKPLTDDQLDRLWLRIEDFRNRGANPATHPLREGEIRIDRDSFGMKFDDVKSALVAEGFTYRDDGFTAEVYYM